MANIVLGIGSSHGPMLVTETDIWDARVPFDKVVRHAWRNGSYSFDELVTARKDENLGRMVSKQVWDEQQVRCQSSIEKLADAFADAKIDVAVVIGNDQMEIFDERLIPAFAVHYGETITNYEFSDERMAAVPVGVAPAIPGYIPKGGAEYPGHPELARHIIRQVMDDNFDVAAMNGMPK
ncbi:MAG: protocatechuate 3,4-dioxygenase, partial [Sphingomonadaceae bacterium]|nr:protocatechuate 3,4-dioxygenase [Sphingomonadaceae bacterium]